MSNLTTHNRSRRDFMQRMTLLSAAMFTASALPFSTSVLADTGIDNWKGQSPGNYNFVDEALGNYPGYSAAIGFGRAHLVADVGHRMVDSQVLV
jgi:hypothetical protein